MIVSESEIVAKLLGPSSPIPNLKERGDTLRQGICPSCGDKSVWTKTDRPHVLFCDHINKCGWTESVRKLIPELYEEFTKRAPPTAEDPNATARAYMASRGFNTVIISDWYKQGTKYITENNYGHASTVDITLSNGVLWQRLIDKSAERAINRKNHLDRKLDGGYWVPPDQTLVDGDIIYITEGIFDAIALHHAGQKVVSAISSGGWPEDLINLYPRALWVIAYDGDGAGHKAARKRYRQMRYRQMRVAVSLPPEGSDFNELFMRSAPGDDHGLSRKVLEDCAHRGRMCIAGTVDEMAYYQYCHTSRGFRVLSHNKQLWSTDVGNGYVDALAKDYGDENTNAPRYQDLWPCHVNDIIDSKLLEITDRGRDFFSRYCRIEPVSNCDPTLIYIEQIDGEIEPKYCFRVELADGQPTATMSIPGASLTDPAAFSKALLTYIPLARFKKNTRAFEYVTDNWKVRKRVATIDHVGYEAHSQSYVYKTWGCRHGQIVEINDEKYLDFGDHQVKTRLEQINISLSTSPLDTSWWDDYILSTHDNGYILAAYWLGSFFANQIRKKHSSFPFLELCGRANTGKSAALRFWQTCSGRAGYEGFDPSKTTLRGLPRALGQLAGPLALIESDRAGGMIDMDGFKDAFDGNALSTRGRATSGNETIETPFRGALLFIQNAAITGTEQITSRFISTTWTRDHFSEAGDKAAARLHDLDPDVVAAFIREALVNEAQITGAFFAHYAAARALLKAEGIKHPRVIHNHSQLIALMHALRILVPAMQLAEHLQRAEAAAIAAAKERERIISGDPLIVEEFFDLIELLGLESVNHSKDPDIIAISLKEIERLARSNHYTIPPLKELYEPLRGCKKHPFIKTGNVKSEIDRGKTRSCFLFRREPQS